jgi:Family of unknown function (DUF6516)
MEIFKWLDDSSFVKSYSTNDFRKSETVFYLNIKIHFVNNSELHVREYIDTEHRKYSFHWQSSNGDLIIRWDNAPHFPDLITFPHHKQLASGEVTESYDISFEEILGFIKAQIS